MPRITAVLRCAVLVAALVLVPARTLMAQEATPTNTPVSPPGTTLNLEGADIKELVRWIAKLTGRNIIVHPDVKGEVTDRGRAAVA